MESSIRHERILILGDGNFSFSICLNNALHGMCLDYCLICTSYDSKEEIGRKYPDGRSILKSLSEEENVTILHNINATSNLRTVIFADNLTVDTDDQNDSNDDVVHHAIFNFPHLGVEDAQLHSVLLAHVMHSVNGVLHSEGMLYLALTDQQRMLWKLDAMAERNGMVVSDVVPLTLALWPGYEVKRHQTGRSFGKRVQSCNWYCLRRRSESPVGLVACVGSEGAAGVGVDRVENLLSRVLEWRASIGTDKDTDMSAVQSADTRDVVSDTLPTRSEDSSAARELVQSLEADSSHGARLGRGEEVREVLAEGPVEVRKNSKKRSRLTAATDGKFTCEQQQQQSSLVPRSTAVLDESAAESKEVDDVPASTGTDCGLASTVSLTTFRCTECGRTFPTERGVRSHVYGVHVLGCGQTAQEDALSDSPALLSAGLACDESAGAESSDVGTEGVFRCSHCEREFRNAEARAQHSLAKHGLHPPSRPAWTTEHPAPCTTESGANGVLVESSVGEDGVPVGTITIPTTGIEIGTQGGTRFECEVCCLSFETEAALQQHVVEGLTPALIASRRARTEELCKYCGKAFVDTRSLHQHENVCSVTRCP